MDPVQLAAMRTEYSRRGLDEAEAGDDPWALLAVWFDDAVASGMREPNAMALATSTPDGVPSVRIVLVKAVDGSGLVFYTHATSRKGREMAANPVAAATMLWHPLQRQLRVEGPVERVDDATSDAYFASRPRGAQLGALASEQSAPIADRAALEERLAWVAETAGDEPVVRPAGWGGYRLVPHSLEFWQGREHRLHDRILFTATADGWDRVRLQP